jgi:hypothetical protein
MAIRVRIRHGNLKHYLISTLKVSMKVDGTDLPQVKKGADASAPGSLRFDVPETAGKVELHVEIPKFNAGSTKPILEFDQRFKVVTTAGKPPRLEPVIFTPPLKQRTTKRYHPRLSEPTTAASGKTKLFDLLLDLRFLDLTDMAKSLGKLDAFKLLPSHPCDIRVYEDTHSRPEPVTWIVAIPRKTQESRKMGVFLFYRPEILPPKDPAFPRYKDTRTAPSERWNRYLLSSDDTEPFFVNSAKAFVENPRCGFEQQLHASGKNVVMVMPLPHVTSYGLGEGPPTVNTVKALLDAMWIESAISVFDLRPPVMTRFAVGGFSSGGNTALQSIKFNPKDIDELYLFDPGRWIGNERLAGWIKTGTDHRLRMTGGGYNQENMIAKVKELRGSDVLLINDKTDYWHTNALYHGALSEVGKPDEGFDPAPAAGATVTPTMPATKEKNIFLVPFASTPPPVIPARLNLEGHWTEKSKPQTGRAFAEGIGIVEAASIVRFRLSGNQFATKAEFNKFISLITNNPDNEGEPNRIRALRHSWSVCGGVTTGRSRDKDFKGYLLIFLEKSGF